MNWKTYGPGIGCAAIAAVGFAAIGNVAAATGWALCSVAWFVAMRNHRR